MEINICSDLHLEMEDLELPGGDVLILSGDVCEATNLTKSHGKPFQEFFIDVGRKYRKVIYVMGNHEHYRGEFGKTASLLRSYLPENITLLDKQTEVIDGVLFIGATLWTNMNDRDPITMYDTERFMNDYHAVKINDRGIYRKLRPSDTVTEHETTVAFIKKCLDENAASDSPMSVVVATHHAPCKASIKPLYHGDHSMNGAYSSDLSNIILDHPEIKLWTHGHTHDFFHYNVGSTQIVCNPRGYAGHEQISVSFNPGFSVTI